MQCIWSTVKSRCKGNGYKGKSGYKGKISKYNNHLIHIVHCTLRVAIRVNGYKGKKCLNFRKYSLTLITGPDCNLNLMSDYNYSLRCQNNYYASHILIRNFQSLSLACSASNFLSTVFIAIQTNSFSWNTWIERDFTLVLNQNGMGQQLPWLLQ